MDTESPPDPTSTVAPPAPARRGIPRPGEIYDPVARALDVIGDRWSLVLVRHLLLGPKGFQELRVRTGIAPRVLSSGCATWRRRASWRASRTARALPTP